MLNKMDLLCFLKLASTLNFTKTAESMYLSQQAVSQRILKIEQELGFPLFTRTRNYVKLTSSGEQLYNFLKPAYDSAESLISSCRQEYAATVKYLRIGYQNMLNWGTILNKAQDDMRSQIPGLEITGELFDSAVLANRLETGQVNMIILYDRFAPQTSGLEKLELLRMPLQIMVSSRDPRINETATYIDFAKLPFIEDVFGEQSMEDTLNRARRTAAKCGLAPSEYIVVANRDSANMAAESGRGIIVGTQFSLAYHQPGLTAFKTPATDTLVCIWKADEENMFVRKYAQCLKKVFAVSCAD